MTFSATTNLSLPIITTGTESGTWGDVIDNGLTSYLDIAIAGGLAISITGTGTVVTLANTAGISASTNITSTTAQYAILNISGAKTGACTLNLPVTSKWYIIHNAGTGGFALTVRGVTPTTGVTLVDGEECIVAWNGTDYVKVASSVLTALTGVLPLANGGTNATSAPAAMASLMGFTTTATGGITTTLVNTSSYYQIFTGTLTQTIQLPLTSTLVTGWTFHICNNSTGLLTVTSSGANTVITVPSGTTAMCTCIGTTSATATDWEAGLTDFSSATGTGAVVLGTTPTLNTPALAGETFSTAATVTAGTNAQGQGALTNDYNVVTTAAANPSGVTLPSATVGRRVIVVNKGLNPVNVYPAASDIIDALLVNISIPLPVGGVMEFNASSVAQWYSTYNLYTTSSGYATTVTAAGATALTSTSGYKQYFTGTTTQTVTLPDVATLSLGRSYEVVNNSTGVLTVNSFGANPISTIPAGMSAVVTCIAITGTGVGSWHFEYTSFDAITGSGAAVFATSPTLTTPGITTSLTTGSTSFDLLNTTATTLNIGGAATAVNIGAATGTVTANIISVANTFGFKNRIINGAFNVGQYPSVSSSGASTVLSAYVTDRWIAQAISSSTGVGFTSAVAAATLPSGGTQNALTVTQATASGTSVSIAQRIEARHLTDLYNSTVTLSYYVSTSASTTISYAIYYAGTTADTWQTVGLGADITSGASLITVNGSIPATASLALKTVTFSLGTTAPTRGIEIIISTAATNGQSLTVTGMQLEKGGAATSFDYRPYPTELTLASRYFGQYGTIVSTVANTNPIVPRTAMRITPTVSAVSTPSGTGAVYSVATYPGTSPTVGFGAAYLSTAHSITAQAYFTLNSEL